MNKIELKRLMTDVAKGKISEKDAQLLIKPKKSDSQRANKPKLNNTRKGKQVLKKKGALE